MMREILEFLSENRRNVVIATILASVVTVLAGLYSMTMPPSYKSYALVMVAGDKDFDLTAGVSSFVGGIAHNPNEIILQSLERGSSFPLTVMRDAEIHRILVGSETLEDRDYSDSELLKLFPNLFSVSKKNMFGSFEIEVVTRDPTSSAEAANRFVTLINKKITDVRLARDLALIENIGEAMESRAETMKVSIRDALYAELEEAMLKNLKLAVDAEFGLTVIDPAAPVLKRNWPALRIVVPFVFTVIFALTFGVLTRRKTLAQS